MLRDNIHRIEELKKEIHGQNSYFKLTSQMTFDDFSL